MNIGIPTGKLFVSQVHIFNVKKKQFHFEKNCFFETIIYLFNIG
jgi:hypothetical protein